jgi:hypothetical protein
VKLFHVCSVARARSLLEYRSRTVSFPRHTKP